MPRAFCASSHFNLTTGIPNSLLKEVQAGVIRFLTLVLDMQNKTSVHCYIFCRHKEEGKETTGKSCICPKWKFSPGPHCIHVAIVLTFTCRILLRRKLTASVVSTS